MGPTIIERSFLESKNTVIDFYADWCKPCKEFEPTFDKYKEQYTNINFIKVNVDDYDYLADEYNVVKVPTFIFFVKGKEVYRVNGAKEDEILKYIESISHNGITMLEEF